MIVGQTVLAIGELTERHPDRQTDLRIYHIDYRQLFSSLRNSKHCIIAY